MIDTFREKMTGINRLALAVSGGADSICMTLLSHQLKLQPIVLIVDHKLREESSEEAEWVSKYIQSKFQFETKILTWGDQQGIKNVQASARNARYNLLIEECKKLNIDYLSTAHNKNDQGETILMNIMRGSGIDGLVGIKPLSKLLDQNLLRPMLDFTREEIIQYLNKFDIEWVNDRSNNNSKYERVKIRHLIREIGDSDLVNAHHLLNRLVLLGNNALRTQNFIDQYVKNKIDNLCYTWSVGLITIDVKQLLEEEEEIILRILRHIIKSVGKQNYFVRLKKLMRLYNSLQISFERKINFDVTLGGCMIWLFLKDEKKYLAISQEKVKKQQKYV